MAEAVEGSGWAQAGLLPTVPQSRWRKQVGAHAGQGTMWPRSHPG